MHAQLAGLCLLVATLAIATAQVTQIGTTMNVTRPVTVPLMAGKYRRSVAVHCQHESSSHGQESILIWWSNIFDWVTFCEFLSSNLYNCAHTWVTQPLKARETVYMLWNAKHCIGDSDVNINVVVDWRYTYDATHMILPRTRKKPFRIL